MRTCTDQLRDDCLKNAQRQCLSRECEPDGGEGTLAGSTPSADTWNTHPSGEGFYRRQPGSGFQILVTSRTGGRGRQEGFFPPHPPQQHPHFLALSHTYRSARVMTNDGHRDGCEGLWSVRGSRFRECSGPGCLVLDRFWTLDWYPDEFL